MVGEIEIPTKHGGYKAGEYIRGLAQLEAQERDRCANFATKAVAAGLAERTVRVAERQGQLMVEMVQTALPEVDLSPEQASALKAALARQARELMGHDWALIGVPRQFVVELCPLESDICSSTGPPGPWSVRISIWSVRILSPFCCLLLLRGAASAIYKGFVGLRS